MDRINSKVNNNYKIKFEGKSNMQEKAAVKIEDYAKIMVSNLIKRVEREIKDSTSYLPASVEEKFSNNTPNLYARELVLKIRPLPKELKETTVDYDTLKWLEATAIGPGGVEASSVLKRGSKEEILATLKSPEFNERILQKFADLDIDLRSN